MKKIAFIIFFILSHFNNCYSQGSIKIDGFFDDWSSINVSYNDNMFDSPLVDLLSFSVANNNEYLFIKIKCDQEIDLTEQFITPSKIIINIDADNNASTGYYTNNIGSEYGINFYDKLIFDDTNFPIVDTLALYSLDVIPLPTYSSDEYEIAINRQFFSDTISISIKEILGGDVMPDNGSVFTYIFDNSTFSNNTIDLLKHDNTDLRIMTYNVWNNGLKSNSRKDEHQRIFEVINADIITYQECGSTNYSDIVAFLDSNYISHPYILTNFNTGNLTISKYPSIDSWQITNRVNAELIDLPDSIYLSDILIINAHPPCCDNNEGRQENFDAVIEFIHDAKTPAGGVIDLPTNTPICFSGDMNLVGYSQQYYTIINGSISDTITFGAGGFPDWDNTPLKDQVSYFNEKDIAYTWDKSYPSLGDYPPGRLDFVFFTNSVMTVSKSFILSTEHMSPYLLSQNNLFWNDTKTASDHFPVIVDFKIPINPTHIKDNSCKQKIINSVDILGRKINLKKNKVIVNILEDGSVEKKIIID